MISSNAQSKKRSATPDLSPRTQRLRTSTHEGGLSARYGGTVTADQENVSLHSHLRCMKQNGGGRRSPADGRRREAISPIPFMMNTQIRRVPSPKPSMISSTTKVVSASAAPAISQPMFVTRFESPRAAVPTAPDLPLQIRGPVETDGNETVSFSSAAMRTPSAFDRSFDSDVATVVDSDTSFVVPDTGEKSEETRNASVLGEDMSHMSHSRRSPVTSSTPSSKVREDDGEEEAKCLERSGSKTEEELFDESEALARQLMEEESNRVMRQLEAAQVRYALEMDDNALDEIEAEDSDLALALRLQREEHQEHNPEYYEHSNGGEDADESEEMTYEEMLELGERLGNVKEERWAECAEKHIKELPLVIFTPRTPGKECASTEEKCLVCQMGYEEGETLKRLPCNHHYHADCIDQWLSRKKTCPVCKKSICSP
eukprot:g3877.t1